MRRLVFALLVLGSGVAVAEEEPISRIGARAWRAGSHVDSVAWSRDGKRVLVGNRNEVTLFDSDGTYRRAFPVPGNVASERLQVSWTGEEKLVAVAGERAAVGLLDLATGAVRALEEESSSATVSHVLLSPDGSALAAADTDRVVRVRDLAGKVTWRLEDAATRVLAWHPDGRRLLVTNESDARLLDVGKGEAWRREELADCKAGCFSPDGKWLALGDGDRVRVVAAGGQQVGEVSPPAGAGSVHALAWSPDGATLACGTLNGVLLVDAKTFAQRAYVEVGTASGLAFAPDGGRLAVAPGTSVVRIVDVGGGKALEPGFAGDGIQHVAFGPGRIYAVTPYGPVVAFSPEGRTLASADLAPGRPLGALAAAPDGSLVAAADSEQIVLATPALAEVARFDAHARSIHGLAFSPDGKRLVSGSLEGCVKLWDVATRTSVALEDLALETTQVNLDAFAFGPDGQLLACESRDSVKVYDLGVAPPKLVATIPGSVSRVAFAGDRLVLAGSETRVCDPRTGAVERKLDRAASWVVASGGVAAFASGRALLLLDLKTGKERTFEAHRGEVEGMALAPDGRSFVTGSADATVGVWKLE